MSICVVHAVFCASFKNNITHVHLARLRSNQEAREGQFPFIASIQIGGQHLCGGTIISKDYILTFGLCADFDVNYIKAVVG